MKHWLSKIVRKFSRISTTWRRPLRHARFSFSRKKLQVIGVTGTNGKTTTTQFIARILEQAGKKVAVASTINFQIGDKKWVNASKLTTLSAWKLQQFLRQAVRADCEYAVIETSSHALDQKRVWGTPYAIAVMTNVTREHLDYHKTMEEYRRAKCRLFRLAKQAVINLDMEDPYFFCTDAKQRALFYSTKDQSAHVFAEHIELDFHGTASPSMSSLSGCISRDCSISKTLWPPSAWRGSCISISQSRQKLWGR